MKDSDLLEFADVYIKKVLDARKTGGDWGNADVYISIACSLLVLARSMLLIANLD